MNIIIKHTDNKGMTTKTYELIDMAIHNDSIIIWTKVGVKK